MKKIGGADKPLHWKWIPAFAGMTAGRHKRRQKQGGFSK
jgi:hypothetical protein